MIGDGPSTGDVGGGGKRGCKVSEFYPPHFANEISC
jgi:hypothetical protein